MVGWRPHRYLFATRELRRYDGPQSELGPGGEGRRSQRPGQRPGAQRLERHVVFEPRHARWLGQVTLAILGQPAGLPGARQRVLDSILPAADEAVRAAKRLPDRKS